MLAALALAFGVLAYALWPRRRSPLI